MQTYPALIMRVVVKADEMASKHPSWRYGQCLFNALSDISETLANQIAGTDSDPYYNEGNLPEFWARLEEMEKGE